MDGWMRNEDADNFFLPSSIPSPLLSTLISSSSYFLRHWHFPSFPPLCLFGLIPAGIIPPFPPNPFGPSIILSTLHTAWQKMDRTASRTLCILSLPIFCCSSSSPPLPGPGFILGNSPLLSPFSFCVCSQWAHGHLVNSVLAHFPLLGIHWPLGSVSRPFPPLDLRYKCLFSLFLPPSSSCPALEESAVNFRANSLQKWGIGTHKNKAAAQANDDD